MTTKKTKNIPLNEATDDQLRKFGETNLGLNFPTGTSRDAMLALITTSDSTGKCIVEAAADPMKSVQATGPVPRNYQHIAGAAQRLIAKGAAMREDPPVLLIIGKTDAEGGDEPVPVSVNGSSIWIPRGVLVEVAYRYYEALKHAVKRVYRQLDDGNLEGREVPAYPMDVKYVPSDEEIAAWAQRTSGNPIPAAA